MCLRDNPDWLAPLPITPDTGEMLMIRPQRFRAISMTRGRVTLKKPSSVVRVTDSQASGFIAGNGPSIAIPALFTRTPTCG